MPDAICHQAAGEFYEIRVKGYLDDCRSAWFDGLAFLHLENGDTILAGCLADQAALWGVLLKIRNLGLVLVAVNRTHGEKSKEAK